MKRTCTITWLAILASSYAQAFVLQSPLQQHYHSSFIPQKSQDIAMPVSLKRQRKSVAFVQTQGIFGLGFGEIAIIAVAIGFLLGPQKIGEILRSGVDASNEMGEGIKKVPEQFQKGLEEGEVEARSRNAKRIKKLTNNEQQED